MADPTEYGAWILADGTIVPVKPYSHTSYQPYHKGFEKGDIALTTHAELFMARYVPENVTRRALQTLRYEAIKANLSETIILENGKTGHRFYYPLRPLEVQRMEFLEYLGDEIAKRFNEG